MSFPSDQVRSVREETWGEKKAPTPRGRDRVFSSSKRMAARKAETDPFPLVPATWVISGPLPS